MTGVHVLGSIVLAGLVFGSSAIAADDPQLVRHALVIGANQGGGTLDPLRYAERDAESFAQVLTELGGFREEDVTVLYQPNVADIRSALARHAALAATAPDDLFVFYYSGHADGHGLRLDAEHYWFDALKHDVRLVESTARVGILDACRSGTITRLKGAKVSPSLFGGNDQIAAQGEVWMTAASADELAQESEALRGGFFTHYLLSGMRGAAAGSDGLVEVQELYSYTRDKVVVRSTEAGGVQRPHFDFNLTGERGIALTDVRLADASLRLTPDRPGHVSVLRIADRVQLAEIDVPADRPMQVALPPGRYLVRLRDAQGLHESTVTLGRGMQAHASAWRPVTSESSTFRGESDQALSFHDRMQRFQSASEALFEDFDLKENPLVAGGLSAVVPGAGQFYNRQPLKGAAYFVGTTLLIGGGALFESAYGPDQAVGSMAMASGITLWGAAIADAVYHVDRYETSRPRTGTTIGMSMGATPKARSHVGLVADYTPIEHLTLGLDRTGAAWAPHGGWDVHVGSRLIGALEFDRFRPGVFVSQGLRFGRQDRDQGLVLRGVLGAGALVRYSVVPRYFIELDARWERDGRTDRVVLGIGFGVPLGPSR